MGADIKTLRTRIKSVDSTLHLTRAMGLVASSKIHRAMMAMYRGREYAASLDAAVGLLTASSDCESSPYMRAPEGGKTALIVIAGDRGLAGGYNANVFRLADTFPDAEIFPMGKRTIAHYASSGRMHDFFPSGEELCRRFAAGEFDRVGIVSTKYRSMMSQEAAVTWLLPLVKNTDAPAHEVIFEPDAASVLASAVPLYVSGMIDAAIWESYACENAARQMAMDSASKNASEMIESLQLLYNRARQGAITQEITEIVAGSGTA